MNIDTVGRIRPPLPGEEQNNLIVTDGKRVHAQQGGNSHSFQILYQPDATNQQLFTKTVLPLLDLFIAGFNTCVLVYGESGSGKSFTIAGDPAGNHQTGIVPQAINYVMTHLQQQPPDASSENPMAEHSRVLLYQYEIYNEIITDLMVARGSLSGRGGASLELETTAEHGTIVKNLQYEPCRNAQDGIAAFIQSWSARNKGIVDFGAITNFSATVFEMDLTMMTAENPHPNRSKFSVIRLPGAEKLSEDLTRARLREGPTLSKAMVSFNQLSADLARQPEPNRVINYGDSKLTNLLEDKLGGNCKTRVICCLKPTASRPDILASILTGCGLLSDVKNYPILNDSLAQNLIMQYRTRLANNLQQGGLDMSAGGVLSRTELQNQLVKVTSDNNQLRERNDRLFQRLEQLQERMTDVAKSKSDLSTKLVASEEEKLKLSKGLVELQLENNRLTEEYEAENFDLKNKIMSLENNLVEFDLEKDKLTHEHSVKVEHTKQLEESRKQIADEFVKMKSNMLQLQKDHEKVVLKNNDLRAEMARLIDTEAALLDLRHNLDRQARAHENATVELQRARALLKSVVDDNQALPPLEKSVSKELEELREIKHGRKFSPTKSLRTSEYALLANHNLLAEKDSLVGAMKSAYDAQTAKVEKKLARLKEQLQNSHEIIQKLNKKASQEAAKVIVLSNAEKNFKSENVELQQKVQEMNQDYRKRLWKYVQDIATFMDDDGSKPGEKSRTSRDKMKNYVEAMMKDMRSAFRSREEQLSNSATNHKKMSKKITQQHELLLSSYRLVRDQLESLYVSRPPQQAETSSSDDEIDVPKSVPINLGPDPAELVITEKDLLSANGQELNKMRHQLMKLNVENKELNKKLKALKATAKRTLDPTLLMTNPNMSLQQSNDFGNQRMRKNMKEFANNAQTELERERSQLLTRVALAEQQLKEQQEYIDIHLAQYKEEILRLRKLLSSRGVKVPENNPLSPRYTNVGLSNNRRPKWMKD